MRLSRDELLIKLGQAKEEAERLVRKLAQISVAQAGNSSSQLLSYRLDKVSSGGFELLFAPAEPPQIWMISLNSGGI